MPGFIPSTLHEIVPYTPSLSEWKVTAGVWAFGMMVFTVGLRIALGTMTGEMRIAEKVEVRLADTAEGK